VKEKRGITFRKKKPKRGDPTKRKPGKNTTFWRGFCINEWLFLASSVDIHLI